jgi:NAD(P)-dependent dehydrogenase (short-subunit alcohol dehydrogenase family)
VKRLEGKVAFVTGAGGGIGRAICERFSAEGAIVIATDVDASLAKQAIFGSDPDRARSLACDVTDSESVRSSIASAGDDFGRLDVLCNVAGGSTDRDSIVTQAPDDEFWRAIKLNLYGPFLCCKHGIPALVKSGGGSVINFSSILAVVPRTGRTCYATAKGGVVSMTRVMAEDYAKDGVRVNAIAPGRTITPRTKPQIAATGGISDKIGSRHLLGLIDPVDIANMTVFLASDESRRVTGQLLIADSGVTVA